MANLKSAIKKIRVDKRRTAANSRWRNTLKRALKEGQITAIYKVADKMSKKHIIHPNKAARIKSYAATRGQSKPSK